MTLIEKQKKLMTPVQKLSKMIEDYFKAEENFRKTESSARLEAKNNLRNKIINEIKSIRQQEQDNRQLKIQF